MKYFYGICSDRFIIFVYISVFIVLFVGFFFFCFKKSPNHLFDSVGRPKIRIKFKNASVIDLILTLFLKKSQGLNSTISEVLVNGGMEPNERIFLCKVSNTC